MPYLPSRRQQQVEAARAGGAPQAVADAQAACKQHNRTAQAVELSKVSKSLEPTLPQVTDWVGVSENVDIGAVVAACICDTVSTNGADMWQCSEPADCAWAPSLTALPMVCFTLLIVLVKLNGRQHLALKQLNIFRHLSCCILIIATAMRSATMCQCPRVFRCCMCQIADQVLSKIVV